MVNTDSVKSPSGYRIVGKVGRTFSQPLRLANPLVRSAGFQPGDPSPDLLTSAEAILYLRLDTINIKHPEETLRRYRDEGHLRGTQVSKGVFYLRSELDDCLKRLTQNNPR